MGSDSFLFQEPVGILPKHDMPMYREPPELKLKLVQNGYEICCEGKEFVAPNLKKAMEMVKEKMEAFEEAAEEGDEKKDNPGNHDY